MLIIHFYKYQDLRFKGISVHTLGLYNDNLVLVIVSSKFTSKALLKSCVCI